MWPFAVSTAATYQPALAVQSAAKDGLMCCLFRPIISTSTGPIFARFQG